MPVIDMFKGIGSSKEHTQNWLHKLKANKFTTTTSDTDCIITFESYLKAGSFAYQWFNAIPPANHTKWVDVESKFTV